MLPLPWASITRSSCFRLSRTPQHIGVEHGGVGLGRLFCRRPGLAFGAGVVDGDVETAEAV